MEEFKRLYFDYQVNYLGDADSLYWAKKDLLTEEHTWYWDANKNNIDTIIRDYLFYLKKDLEELRSTPNL